LIRLLIRLADEVVNRRLRAEWELCIERPT